MAQSAPDPGRCGGRIDAQPAGDTPLVMSGSFPPRVGAGTGTFDGSVTVTNRSDRHVSGTTSPRPGVYVTRSGEIVAVPLPTDAVGVLVDLAPGSSREFPATGALLGCAGGKPLAPGRYDIHAVLTVFEATGATSTSGGPWPIEVG